MVTIKSKDGDIETRNFERCFQFLFSLRRVTTIEVNENVKIEYETAKKYFNKISKIFPGEFTLNQTEFKWYYEKGLSNAQIYCLFCAIRYCYQKIERYNNIVKFVANSKLKASKSLPIAHATTRHNGFGYYIYQYGIPKYMFDLNEIHERKYLNDQFIYTQLLGVGIDNYPKFKNLSSYIKEHNLGEEWKATKLKKYENRK